MPIYEYDCQDCKRRVTVWRRPSETDPLRCPVCDGDKLTRLISQVSIVKSQTDRIRDLSWIDKDIARRFKDKSK